MIEMRGKARWMMVVVIALAASLTLAACNSSDDGEAAVDGSGGEAEPAPETVREDGFLDEAGGFDREATASSGGSSGPGGLGSLQVDLTADDSVFESPKVIKEGQVELRVERDTFGDSVDEVTCWRGASAAASSLRPSTTPARGEARS